MAQGRTTFFLRFFGLRVGGRRRVASLRFFNSAAECSPVRGSGRRMAEREEMEARQQQVEAGATRRDDIDGSADPLPGAANGDVTEVVDAAGGASDDMDVDAHQGTPEGAGAEETSEEEADALATLVGLAAGDDNEEADEGDDGEYENGIDVNKSPAAPAELQETGELIESRDGRAFYASCTKADGTEVKTGEISACDWNN